MQQFDQEAPSIMSRDKSYQLEDDKLRPQNLYIGDKALVYIYAYNYNVHNNFWWVNVGDTSMLVNLWWWQFKDVGDSIGPILLVTFSL